MIDHCVEYEPKGIDWAVMDANDDGREAYELGLGRDANRHQAGTRLHQAWVDGWGTQQAAREADQSL